MDAFSVLFRKTALLFHTQRLKSSSSEVDVDSSESIIHSLNRQDLIVAKELFMTESIEPMDGSEGMK